MSFRGFIAMDLSSSIREELRDVKDSLARHDCKVHWTDPRDFHLTLKYCGTLDPKEIVDVSAVIKDVFKHFGPILLHVKGIGTFPDLVKKPEAAMRVIWAGVHCAPRLHEAHQALELTLMDRVGIRVEPKLFHPHITLGNVKTTKELDKLKEEVITLSDEDFGECTVSSIVLYDSKSTSNGPVYTPLSTVHL